MGGFQTCQRLDGNLLVRNSYKLSIRSRIFKSRIFGAKSELYRKKLFKIRIVDHSVTLAKMPVII